MVNVSDLSIKSLETIMAYDLAVNGGAFRFMLDELQSATIANSQENTNLTGRGGSTIGVLKRNKSVTISGANGMISVGLASAEVGAEVTDGNAVVRTPDYLTVASNEATTTFTAVGTAGNEIGEVFVKDVNGMVTNILEQDASAAEGKFAYNPTTKKITFNSGDLADNTEIVVYYDRQVSASAILENIASNYSDTLAIYVDAIAEDKCGKEYHVQFYLPKVDFQGNFEIAMGDSQTVHNFEATSSAIGCGTANSKFWTLTVFGDDE